MNSCKNLIITYFQSWQTQDWDKMRACLNKKFHIDAGQLQFKSVDVFIEFCKNGPSWSQIRLLEALFLENKAALLYEGITPTKEKVRIAEFFDVTNNEIIKSQMTITLG